jgi:uncharacterized protein (TIGR02145 family)
MLNRFFLATLMLIFVCNLSAQEYGSFKDSRDGKVYKTVKIGNHEWMAENLKATMFRDGTPIPKTILNNNDWQEKGFKKLPLVCDKDNNPANGLKFGKLYNWYTVNDSRGLAPDGWHIPTVEEWTELFKYFGSETNATKNIKSKTGWIAHIGNGSNESGFNALAAGFRGDYGVFGYQERSTIWWSAGNESYGNAPVFETGEHAWFEIFRLNEKPSYYGCSVRCIRDLTIEEEKLLLKNKIEQANLEKTKEYDKLNAIQESMTKLVDSVNNMTYGVVKIGNLYWMTENLNSINYSDGSRIQDLNVKLSETLFYNSSPVNLRTNYTWGRAAQNNQPGWCHYDNNPLNGEKYGKLYNWFALNSPSGLCPKGWVIPSIDDWKELVNFFGGESKSGTDLRSNSGWQTDYIGVGNGTNKSNFNGKPGGQIHSGGKSDLEGRYGYWWSSSSFNDFSAYTFGLNQSEKASFNSSEKNRGLSVRCVKPIENIVIVNAKKNEVLLSKQDNKCPLDFIEISLAQVSGTAKKYKAIDGHFYYQVKINVKPSILTSKYTTKITVKRTQKSENVPLGSIYKAFYINGSSGTFTFDGSFDSDYFEIEGSYSCRTGRFGGPSAKIYFRDLKIIQ